MRAAFLKSYFYDHFHDGEIWFQYHSAAWKWHRLIFFCKKRCSNIAQKSLLQRTRQTLNSQEAANKTHSHLNYGVSIVKICEKLSMSIVPMCPIINIPALVQIMAWRRWGDKPLSEPMMVRLPMHICVTRPQWVNTSYWYKRNLTQKPP